MQKRKMAESLMAVTHTHTHTHTHTICLNDIKRRGILNLININKTRLNL